MFAQIRESYICPSAFGDVRRFVLQCEQYQQFRARPAKAAHQWSIKCSTLREHWMVDVVHMPKSKSGNKWMLTMIDICSRWAIARPVSNIQHQEMAHIIMEEWAKVGVHIVHRKATNDGGGEFKARFEDMPLCHLLKKERRHHESCIHW